MPLLPRLTRSRAGILRALAVLVTAAASASAVVTVGGPSAAAVTVIDGPDVSSYQHPNGATIGWASVRKSGREFAIVKTTEGTSYVNKYFASDYAGIANAAMVRGSYHFARPARPLASSALAQAKFYVSHLPNVNAVRTLPPTLDLEVTGGLSRAELIVWAQDFLLDVRQLTGRTPMLYTYPYFWKTTLGDPAAFAPYPLWMAAYSGPVDPAAMLWQYTASASVSGIRGGVDMSKLTPTAASWAALSDGSKTVGWPALPPSYAQRVVARAGAQSATVTWLPPDTGSAPIAGYTVQVVETGQSVAVGPTATSATFTGLTAGASYTLAVTARNVAGPGLTAVSNAVTPTVPSQLITTASAQSLYIGGTVTYVSTLTNPTTDAGMAGEQVQVFTRPLGSTTWGLVDRLTTDAAGTVTLVRSPTRSTQVRVYFQGRSGVAPAATLTTTVVRTRVTAGLSHSVVAVGRPVVLSGYISPRFAHVIVVRQVWSHSAWRNAAQSTTSANGVYAFRITPGGISTTRMRVVVAANHGRAPGYSPEVVLRVR